MVNQDKPECICDDMSILGAKFMHGWRYCAYCGVHLESKLNHNIRKLNDVVNKEEDK